MTTYIKHLLPIIFILFVSTVTAQSSEDKKIREIVDDVISEMQSRPTYSITFKQDVGNIISYYLQKYKKDCYKDSTLSHTYTPKWNDRCLRQTGNLADGYSFVTDCKDSTHYTYIHRLPTFEGFTEWLDKQTNL